MGRSTLLVLPVIAVLGAGGWWVFGRDSHPKTLGPIEEADAATEAAETPPDVGELKGGLKALIVGPTATSASPYRIDGLVVDEKGKAIESVTIRAHTWGGKVRDPDDTSSWGDPKTDDPTRKEFAGIDDPKVADGSNDATAKSDKDGKFSITVAEAGNFEVSALPVAGRSSGKTWANPTKIKPVAKVTVKLLPGTTVTGRVVDADDKGVASFVSGSVTTDISENYWQNSVEIPSTATDSTGAFTLLAVPEGKGSLVVKVAGRGSFTGFAFTAPAKEPLVLKIGAAGVVKG